MPILPDGSMITFTSGMVTATVAVSSIKYRYARMPFKRPEFSNQRLNQAPNENGSMPTVVMTQGNVPTQYINSCNPDDTERDYSTDDDNLDNIFKRWDLFKFEIVGATSLTTEVAKLLAISQAHQIKLAQYDAHFEIVGGYVSYNYLKNTAQAETFSAISTTGLSMSGKALSVGTQSDLLMVDFQPDVENESPDDLANSTSTVLETWSMTLEKRILQAARSGTW